MKKFIRALAIVLCLSMFTPLVVQNYGVSTVQAATKIKLNYSKKTIGQGDTFKLKISGTNKKVTWSSSNKKIATVTSNGVVKGKNVGLYKKTCKITAKVGGKKYVCNVTVKGEMGYNDLAALGWIAMDEYVRDRFGGNTNVTIGNIYTGTDYDGSIKTVVYECSWGNKKYYAAANWIEGRQKSFSGKSMIIKGYDDYSIPCIGLSAFQEKDDFDTYYTVGQALDYYTVRDLYDEYKEDENYRFISDSFL